MPVLLYGLEACELIKAQIASLDFVINRFFMKLFSTNNINIVKSCQEFFCFDQSRVQLSKRVEKFVTRFYRHRPALLSALQRLYVHTVLLT